MKKQRFVCNQCGNRFEVEVYEKGEAKEKKVPVYPVRCPKCQGSVSEN